MGAGGADVQLSAKAKRLFPYEVECKNQQKFKGIYAIMEQADSHGKLVPLGVIKMNHKKPLVIVDAEHFFELLAK